MSATQKSVRATEARRSDASSKRWWVLAVAGLAQLMVTLDVTIVNIALPAAQRDLGFSDASRQWVITAYSLAFGSLLLVSGRLTDLFGRRITLLTGLALFGAGSALGGAAADFAVLVVARVVQGIGGALLAPAALATVNATFTNFRERARAFSVFGAIGAAGGGVGLLLGGLLTEHLDWRWTLYVNLAIAVLAIVGTVSLIGRDAPGRRPPLDLPGTALVSSGLFALVYGFSDAETHAWSAPATWLALTVSAVLLTGFVLRQLRARHPLLPLRILLDRNRGASFGSLLIMNIGLYAVFLFLTYYLQLDLHYTPVGTGLAFLPLVIGIVAASTATLNVLIRHVGPRLIVPAGMLIAAANLVWLAHLGAHTSYASGILPPLALLGAGLGMVFPAAISISTAGLDRSDGGIAGAAVNTTQQVGGSVGVALLSTLAASAATTYLTRHHPHGPGVLRDAAIHSYSAAYLIAAAVFSAGAIAVGLLFRSGVPQTEESGPPVLP